MEAALRTVSEIADRRRAGAPLEFHEVRGIEGIKEADL